MSPGPPSPRSITSLQGSWSPPHDCNSISSVNGECDGGNVTCSQSPTSPDPPPLLSIATAAQHSSSHETMSSDLSSRKSVDLAAHGPSSLTPSPYDSSTDDCDDCGCVALHWCDIMGPTCTAQMVTSENPYDSNINDDDDDTSTTAAAMVMIHRHSGLLAPIIHLESPMI